MKRIVILIIMVCYTSNLVFAEKEHSIDIKLSKCMKNAHSTVAMNNCSYDAIEEWEKEINKSMKLIKKKVSAEKYNYLVISQNKWDEYYKAENATIRELIFNKQGTIHTNFAAGCSYGMAKKRAQDLKFYYDVYNNFVDQ